MNGQSKGRRGESESRRVWTARLNRFASARSAKQRAAVFETAHKINPGGTLRDMLQAWGYSASARGRKPKGVRSDGSGKTARERLELTLDELFGEKPTPVPSLYAKLAGRADTTVKDAIRIVAALFASWPETIGTKVDKAVGIAERFVRELLSELSSGRSYDWDDDDLEVHVFRLVDEERVGVSHFIKDAGEKEGALIVAGARNILLGAHPVDIIRQFHSVTSEFIGAGRKGILIFVFDTAIFEAGREGFNLLYNIGLLSTAVTAFALFSKSYDYIYPIQQHKVDWSRWRTLSRRCCVVIRKPPLIDPQSGALLRHNRFDDFIADWRPEQEFARLDDLKGFMGFESGDVLPRTYPAEPGYKEMLSGRDLYWDVLVRPSPTEPEGLGVQYFIPPVDQIVASAGTTAGESERLSAPSIGRSRRGRPANKTVSIEEDLFYVTRRPSPGRHYDHAQRAIYMAARGRLKLDSGAPQAKNLNAAAALREVGFEVLPISIMVSLFPRALHFATSNSAP